MLDAGKLRRGFYVKARVGAVFKWPLEADDKAKQVLEICEAPRSGWGEILADLIMANRLAEAVAKINFMKNSEIDSNVGSENGFCGGKGRWRKRKRAAGRDQASTHAGEMRDAGTNR